MNELYQLLLRKLVVGHSAMIPRQYFKGNFQYLKLTAKDQSLSKEFKWNAWLLELFPY